MSNLTSRTCVVATNITLGGKPKTYSEAKSFDRGIQRACKVSRPPATFCIYSKRTPPLVPCDEGVVPP